MHYTLGTAAKATGKSKPTIQRAIKSGKISAEKDANGDWKIEPAELHRIFPPVVGDGVTNDSSVGGNDLRNVALHERLDAALQRVTDKEEQLRLQAKQIEDLQKDRDHWRQQATYLLDDKREKEGEINNHLTAERELREKLATEIAQREQTGQRLTETQATLEKVRNSWLGRLLFKV